MFSKFEDIPTALERELRPSTTHVIVFSIFRHAYKRMTLTRKGKSHKQYSVTFPNPDYRAESSVPIIKEMLMQIKNICPQAQLYIMIPVFPDLPYYNIYRNIKFAPTENYYKYVEIANEDKLEMSITNILSNPSLYHEAQHPQKQVDVVSKALDKLQSDTAILSIAVNEWLVLLESEVLDPYKANIRKRMEEATEPFFFVANMMDPQYLG
ncbi:hypothetical protein Anas_05197 [Armadillidium nasatum]|uniref:Uncharacterized protein n=1 Tax=Armadillidium nasatum TaxID=96803 RepID=A0A5N5SRC7_9CRUS|nr:hypothetical protein Anas_05197 [Armadillidium nasatum]